MALLQVLVSLALFHDYIFGGKYFAYVDIGSDTFSGAVPALIHLASSANWASAWSFNIGLGAPLPLPLDPFILLGIAAGPEHILDMRIWVYVAKIFAGGAAFYGFILAIGARREVALIVALAYSFCGFVTTEGQWDPFANDFVAYALVLWAVARRASHDNSWLIPLAVAFSFYGGVFFVSACVLILYAFAAAMIAANRPLATANAWLRTILPQCALGLLLAAPVILPLIFQLLDSPRISGAQAGFDARLSEIFSINERITVFIELAGFFHKNILGIGSQHMGWMNYLESPAFFVGMFPLLLIPQLWRGSHIDRRILVAGVAAVGLFVMLPAIRYLAFGFGLDYFRVNNLWISILLLTMFARALIVIMEKGIHRWLLFGAAAVLALLIVLLEAGLRPVVSIPHTIKILAFLCAALVLGLGLGRLFHWRQFALLMLGFVALEAAVINYPSFHDKRVPVTRKTPGYVDATLDALAFLRSRDPGFYRTEKTYDSVGLNDALGQGYMGVKTYWFHGSSEVRLHTDLGLLPLASPIKNFTNWLQNFGGRFALYSLVGVKYIISRAPVEWLGFRKIHEANGLLVYENDFALPLGVVYERQFTREKFLTLTLEARDITMMNAVVVDELRGSAPRVFDTQQFTRKSTDWLLDNYVSPARRLQARGLAVEQFSNSRISGQITSDVPGILVFSIPYKKGWSVFIDGGERPVFRAHLGMLATEFESGKHRVELRYSLPGFVPGLFGGLLGLFGVWRIGALKRRTPYAQLSGTNA